MKLLLTFISIICLSIGLAAKPEKKGKGDKPGRPSREEMMKKFDKDGDGKLSDEEKAEIRKAMSNRTPPAHILEKFDKDGDGKLSDEEKAGMRKEIIAKFDKDGDGKHDEVIKHIGYTTDIITDLALDWMKTKRDKDKPFMLMYQHKAPHRNWQPGPKYLNKYDDIILPEPDTLFDNYKGRTLAAYQQDMTIAETMNRGDLKLDAPGNLTPEQRKVWDTAYNAKNEALKNANLKGKDLVRWKYQRYVKDYLRCIASVDDGVGRMLDYLKETGLEEDTIVIYCSDQGFYLGEHGWFDKRWMYEESLRTPMLVRWPGVIKPGSRNGDIVSPIDFASTFCEVAGIDSPSDLHGRSMVSLLKGKAPKDWRKSFYYHYYEYPGYHWVRRHYGVADGRYKLIHFYEDDVDQWELFDLKNDPSEMTSVYGTAKYAVVQNRLSRQLALHRKNLQVPEEDPPQSVVKRLPPRTRKPTAPQ